MGHPEADGVLQPLLSQWQAPTVPGSFEADVLRAIRCAGNSKSERVGWQLFVPAGAKLAAGVTLVLLLVTGAWSGLQAGRAVVSERMSAHPVYRQQTLTGAYLVAATSRGMP